MCRGVQQVVNGCDPTSRGRWRFVAGQWHGGRLVGSLGACDCPASFNLLPSHAEVDRAVHPAPGTSTVISFSAYYIVITDHQMISSGEPANPRFMWKTDGEGGKRSSLVNIGSTLSTLSLDASPPPRQCLFQVYLRVKFSPPQKKRMLWYC